ncbi:MAG: hypothetical protein OEW39_01760 [Deltaproteobacteria bacterium]|nr:hypothetical protein [Deltaproteobacteria bacterium]
MKRLLFPPSLRDVSGGRWIRISLRTWHLASMAFLVGGVAQGVPMDSLQNALWGLTLSGVAYVAMELYTSFVFLLQLKGLAVVAKVVLMGAAAASPDHALTYLVVAIIIGGISSHMPGKYRYYSVFHGRILKE